MDPIQAGVARTALLHQPLLLDLLLDNHLPDPHLCPGAPQGNGPTPHGFLVRVGLIHSHGCFHSIPVKTVGIEKISDLLFMSCTDVVAHKLSAEVAARKAEVEARSQGPVSLDPGVCEEEEEPKHLLAGCRSPPGQHHQSAVVGEAAVLRSPDWVPPTLGSRGGRCHYQEDGAPLPATIRMSAFSSFRISLFRD